MVRPERFELPTYCSGGNRSIHLSYGRTPEYSVYMAPFGRSNVHPGWRFVAKKNGDSARSEKIV
jgi:hypothetical protein